MVELDKKTMDSEKVNSHIVILVDKSYQFELERQISLDNLSARILELCTIDLGIIAFKSGSNSPMTLKYAIWFLAISVILSMFSLFRYKVTLIKFPNDLQKDIYGHYDQYEDDDKRTTLYCKRMDPVVRSLSGKNDIRVKLLVVSMGTFFLSLLLVICSILFT